MARHVWLGEHPLFLWGQRYKGVPEVYLTAAAFRVTSPSVAALKAVTLCLFILFLWMNFRLLQRVSSQAIGWTATAFLIAGPPSLVLWTLSGSAEVVLTLLVGTLFLLAIVSWSETRSTLALLVASAALGFGLWIQQFILYYVATLLITALITVPGLGRLTITHIRADVPAWLKPITMLLASIGVIYVALGLIAFFTSGVHVRALGLNISITHPQKTWWIAGLAFASCALALAAAIFKRRAVGPAFAFLVGYAPALLGRIGNSGLGAPISRLDALTLRRMAPDIAHQMLPILFGWRDPAGQATVPFAAGAILILVVTISYAEAARRTVTPFFHVFPFVAAAMFIASGSYVDAQSYRYLMPIYAALPVVYATGIVALWRISRLTAATVLVLALSVFVVQQIDWYARLSPDRESQRMIACLDARGIRAARSGYWHSYKLTFLTHERVIVSPTDGIDRYAPYSARTRSAPGLESILAECR